MPTSPVMAYLIRLATLAGDSEFAIRLVAVACMTLSVWVIYRLACGHFNERVAEIAAVFVSKPHEEETANLVECGPPRRTALFSDQRSWPGIRDPELLPMDKAALHAALQNGWPQRGHSPLFAEDWIGGAFVV